MDETLVPYQTRSCIVQVQSSRGTDFELGRLVGRGGRGIGWVDLFLSWEGWWGEEGGGLGEWTCF